MKPLCAALDIRMDPARHGAFVIAFVGAGGKTSAMFALARELREHRVIVTATTKLRDPRLEVGRNLDTVVVEKDLAARVGDTGVERAHAPRAGGGPLVLASAVEAGTLKFVGIHPDRVAGLRSACDFVLVEADGSRGLPVKAPTGNEPLLPDCADLVVGVVGLDCLGLPLGPGTAHRPDVLGALVGCASGERIRPEHLFRLARSPQGLFKGVPDGTRKAILLNKAELAPSGAAAALAEALVEKPEAADTAIACSLWDGGIACAIAACVRTTARNAEGRP